MTCALVHIITGSCDSVHWALWKSQDNDYDCLVICLLIAGVLGREDSTVQVREMRFHNTLETWFLSSLSHLRLLKKSGMTDCIATRDSYNIR